MERRSLMLAAGGLLGAAGAPAAPGFRRNRPDDPGWPSEAEWAALGRQVGRRLSRPDSPFAAGAEPRLARNPWFLAETPALPQASGWAGAWQAVPSAFAVAAEGAADVVAAVDFARAHRLRLVVRGGGHGYQGGSAAPDSLLVWTRPMRRIALHAAFVPEGCAGALPRPAVSLGAGVTWGEAYDAVTVQGGRYVQGGGCMTVGVAGLVQSGGFGSFSRCFGLAAGSLLEAELVTADGAVRIVNACGEPELFWALRGGGGGSFGVVTRLTLATHDLPDWLGGVFGAIRATSDAAFRRLLARVLAFAAETLSGPRWGEQLRIRPDNTLAIGMVFQGLDQAAAAAQWRPFLDWVARAPGDHVVVEPVQILALPARRMWDAAWLRANAPGLVVADDRPGAAPGNLVWAGDAGQAGQYLHGYQSAWLPTALLAPGERDRLAAALFEASRHWAVSLHLNKGLAGAPAQALAAARETAINPAALDAFALAICGSHGPPAYAGLPGPGPDLGRARQEAGRIGAAMAVLRDRAGATGAYLAESDYHQPGWQEAFWGGHYDRLLAAKRRYDPEGLFFVHHGVGSEDWTEDGFARAG